MGGPGPPKIFIGMFRTCIDLFVLPVSTKVSKCKQMNVFIFHAVHSLPGKRSEGHDVTSTPNKHYSNVSDKRTVYNKRTG